MLGEQIEAVFENGVFRPLQPVHLPDRQRVVLVLPPTEPAEGDVPMAEASELFEDVGYEPLPLERLMTIRVRLKRSDDFGPLPYPVKADDL
jgi:predicted DNA-binding antitoxin AbrB/MazE fold protein